jgi:hypothetical protein
MNARVGSLAALSLVLILALTASAQSRKSADLSEVPAIRAFSVTLVVGEMQGASTPDNLPVGARKALTDMREFLPYKSFRLLDTQFIRCCASMQPEQVRGRLRGVDDQPYPFLINVNYRGGRLSIHFSLQESAAKSMLSSKVESGDEDPLKEDRKMLELRDALERSRREIENNRRRLSSQEVFARELLSRLNQLRAKKSTPAEQLEQETQRALDEARKEISHLQKMLATQEPEARELELKFAQMQHGRAVSAEQRQVAPMSPSKSAVIDSTFSMDVGETVVIGTSSLKGDKALIALLTAVPRPESSRGEQK